MFNTIKTKMIPRCHSERSEESSYFKSCRVSLETEVRHRCYRRLKWAGCFAPLNMKNDLCRTALRHHEALQRFSHFFLTHHQINKQHIQRDEFEPKVINRLPQEQQKK